MVTLRGVRARCGRLLLFAALLLGIVTMHTLGHPTGEQHGGMTPAASAVSASSASAVSAAGATGHSTAGHGRGVERPAHGTAAEHAADLAAGSEAADPAANPVTGLAAEPAAAPAAGPAADDPVPAGHGMDPMAVCLAVLLGAVALVLLAAAPLRSGDRPEPVAPRGPPLSRHRPSPPPPRALLSRLCLLRI